MGIWLSSTSPSTGIFLNHILNDNSEGHWRVNNSPVATKPTTALLFLSLIFITSLSFLETFYSLSKAHCCLQGEPKSELLLVEAGHQHIWLGFWEFIIYL